uniref:Chemosensory protein 9 n=1 Tax=Pyrrhalta aenescens TaxID=281545 RepID=A0A1J0KKR9_9CUCU|nr:chemosensory protein 9 [Pyrrhalta aenescens]
MNRWCMLFIVLVVVAAVLGAPKKSFEENLKVLRKIDINTVLNNGRIIKSYVDCVTGKKRCTAEGTALKESWKEGLDKECDACEEEEKKKIKKIAKHIYTHYRPLYDELAAALDKDGKLQERYKAYIDEILNDPTI